MKLSDLNPRWAKDFSDGPVTRVTFDCPHCRTQRLGVPFTPTMPDGVLQRHGVAWPNPNINEGKVWQRTGATFDTLTLYPSIDASKSGHWHGHITSGQIK